MNKGRLVKRLTVAMLALGLLGVNIRAMAEVAAESRKLSILSVKGDNGTVIKGGTREIQAAAGMRLAQGSKVKTGAATQIYLEADNDKVMKLDSSSTAEITGVSSKKLKITLKSGSLFFQVDRKLAEDEDMTFDAAQTSMSIRGTGGTLSFQEDSLVFTLAEGAVDWQIGNETVHVEAGEQVVLEEVEDGSALDVNGMNSVYELEEKKKVNWRELDAFTLEAVLEQERRMDLSAIGYDREANRQEALELLQIKKNVEKEEQERQQGQIDEVSQERGGNAVQRQDGRPPAERNGSSGSGKRKEPTSEAVTKPSSSEEESTSGTKPSESEEEPTSEEEPSGSEEEPTSEENPSESEKPTSGTKPSESEKPTSGTVTDPPEEKPEPPKEDPDSSTTNVSSDTSVDNSQTPIIPDSGPDTSDKPNPPDSDDSNKTDSDSSSSDTSSEDSSGTVSNGSDSTPGDNKGNGQDSSPEYQSPDQKAVKQTALIPTP